jgi:hypothetical protein
MMCSEEMGYTGEQTSARPQAAFIPEEEAILR